MAKKKAIHPDQLTHICKKNKLHIPDITTTT
jgi:hypothetical protein